MKKDIVFPTVEGVSVAVVRKLNELNLAEWYVYVINENNFPLETLIVSSRGYGEIEGEQRQASVLRHAFGAVEPNSFVLIEPIDPAVFPLNNEFWVSYYIGPQIYDKRFTFVPESIVEENLIKINKLNMEGILHE
jgi:hypothetical protein